MSAATGGIVRRQAHSFRSAHPAPAMLRWEFPTTPRTPADEEDWTARAVLIERYRQLHRAGRMGAIWPASGGYFVAPAHGIRGQSYHLAEFMTAAEFRQMVEAHS